MLFTCWATFVTLLLLVSLSSSEASNELELGTKRTGESREFGKLNDVGIYLLRNGK
jgi:hypothetical protein